MIELTLIFQSFICLPRYEHFLAGFFCKIFLALLNRILPILERLKESIMKPWKPLITDRSKCCWHWFPFKFKRLVILNVHDVKNKSTNEQGHAASKHFSKISEIFLSSVPKITDLKSLLKSALTGKDAFDISLQSCPSFILSSSFLIR